MEPITLSEEVLAKAAAAKEMLKRIDKRISGRAYSMDAAIMHALTEAHGNVRTYVELGVAFGASMCLVANHLGHRNEPMMIGVDMFAGRDFVSRTSMSAEITSKNLAIYNYGLENKIDIRLIRGDYTGTSVVEQMEKMLGDRRIDMLFIDGLMCNVKLMMENYHPLMGMDGLIAINCVGSPLAADPNYVEIGRYGNLYIAQRKKAPGERIIPVRKVPLISLKERQRIEKRRKKAQMQRLTKTNINIKG